MIVILYWEIIISIGGSILNPISVDSVKSSVSDDCIQLFVDRIVTILDLLSDALLHLEQLTSAQERMLDELLLKTFNEQIPLNFLALLSKLEGICYFVN